MGEAFFDAQASAQLVQYISSSEERTLENTIAALDAFKKSTYARIFLRFVTDTKKLDENFRTLLDSMHVERYSFGSNILMQSMLKKKFLFVISGCLKFEAENNSDSPLTPGLALLNGGQSKLLRKRTFAKSEVQLPRIFSPGQAVTPQMYPLFAEAKELIACSQNNEKNQIDHKNSNYLEVATLNPSKYIEIMGIMEEQKLNFIMKFIKNSGILVSSIGEDRIQKLANSSEIRETTCGSIIFSETDAAEEVFLVLEGEFIEKKTKQLFGDEESHNGMRNCKAECVSQEGAIIVFSRQYFSALNKDTRNMHLTSLENNNSDNDLKYHQSSEFFMKQQFTRRPVMNIKSLNQINDLQCSMTASVANIQGNYTEQKYPATSECENNNNSNNGFTKKELSQMQSSTPAFATYTKSNKHLQSILGTKISPNSASQQIGTDQNDSMTKNYSQLGIQSPKILSSQLGNRGGGNHFHSRSNLHFNQSYFTNPSSGDNESKQFISPKVFEKELGDRITSPVKVKSSLFRARKYQSERQLQDLSPPFQEVMKQQAESKTVQAQNYSTNASEYPEESVTPIGEILPVRSHVQEKERNSSVEGNLKLLNNPQKRESFSRQSLGLDNDNQAINVIDKGTGNSEEVQENKQSYQFNPQGKKGLQSPKTSFSPLQKQNNSIRLFHNDSIPSIAFSKRTTVLKGVPGRVVSRIGSFASQDFNYPASDGIENDGTPTPNGAGSKTTNISDNSPKKGTNFGVLSGAPGLTVNLVTRKKPVSVMGSFSQFQSLKHINDSEEAQNRPQMTTSTNENEMQKSSSLPKRFKNVSTISISKQLDLDQDKSNLIPACSPNSFKALKTLPLSRPQPSISSTYFPHGSPKKNLIVKSLAPKESSNQDLASPQSLLSPGTNSSKQSSLHKDLQQTIAGIYPQSEEEVQTTSSLKLKSTSKFPAHPQRHISKSQKHIYKSQPQLQLEISQKNESDDSSKSESDESFTMYDNLAQTNMLLQSANNNNTITTSNPIKHNSLAEQQILKMKPSIPLLNLKSLGENGSQVNNFFGNSGVLNKNQFDAEGNKPAVSIENKKETPSDGILNSNEQNRHEIFPLKSSEQQPLSQSTTWCQSKTLTNISKIMKSQETTTEATTAKMPRSESHKPSQTQQSYIEIQSQRPSTPSMKKLNLSNIGAQIKKIAPPPNIKEDGYGEIQQSRLILPSFHLAQTGQTSSQPLFFNSQSNDSSPANQLFSNGLLQNRKTTAGFDSLSFFTPQPLHAMSPNNFNQLSLKYNGSTIKQTQSNKNINLIYSALQPTQTADRKVYKIYSKQGGEPSQESSHFQEPG